ncbi:response regulator transcription factor [Paenibacillus silviterrae]|uniref:response regulator transcription factor n=1 Tax=Paenibacillus silviterrae TaxID=3242194 RepID=UPI002542D57D|nr:response regulator [Paenibacillus chinjuensis]
MYKVMIAEDEDQIRIGLKKTIEEVIGGFKVVAEAANGKDALDQLHKTSPDILITDIRMPEMNGIETIRRVRNNFPNLYIIIVSGYGDFEYAKQAIKYQVAEYLLKPVNRVELAEVLQSIKRNLDAGNMSSNDHELTDEMNEGRHVIRKVKDIVAQNMAEDISLQRVAGQVNLTPHYLSVLFKTVSGQNYSDFVTDSRMIKAKQLLKETNLKIHEIANMTGYVSAKHFMNVFKQRVGKTPSDYRNHGS